jgi:CRISPR-associated Csx2 family protein
MPNTYISVLGTGDYAECTYFLGDGFEKPGVRFVQEATVDAFCRDWGTEDRVLILATEKACQVNWLDDGHKDSDCKALTRQGLQRRLSSLRLQAGVQRIPIPEGKSEAEIRRIFQTLFDVLRERDKVVFDITHSFRSIPLLVTVVLQYAKTLKGISVEGIYYGAFEVLGHPSMVRKMPLEDRRVPIFDLTPFSTLLDWSVAIDRFLGTGDAAAVCGLAQDAVKPILMKTKGTDETAAAVKAVAKGLDVFSRDLSTCRGPLLSGNAAALKERIAACRNENLVAAFTPLLDRLYDEISPFDGEEINDGIRAARWCLDHNLIQQGYTILQEFLVNHIARGARLDPFEKTDRQIVNQAITIAVKGLPEEKWLSPAGSNPEKTARALAILDSAPDLAKMFRNIADDRNDLNHAGCNKTPKKSQVFLKNLPRLLERAERAVDPESAEREEQPDDYDGCSP